MNSLVDLGDVVWCGITVNQHLVFGMGHPSNSLRVLDNSFELIKDVKLKDAPYTLLLLGDKEHMLCGGKNC